MKQFKQTAAYFIRGAVRFFFASPFVVVFIAASAAIPLLAFEAHVVNVTATIEKPPICEPKPVAYWAVQEGCSRGSGSSVWVSEINELSAGQLSGFFGSITGEEICQTLWMRTCSNEGRFGKALCFAEANVLADELNVVSGKLPLGALVAGAYDGSAFDDLGITPEMTIGEALAILEAVLANPDADAFDILDAEHVAKRIYLFYGNQPVCIFNPEDIPEEPPPFTPFGALNAMDVEEAPFDEGDATSTILETANSSEENVSGVDEVDESGTEGEVLGETTEKITGEPEEGADGTEEPEGEAYDTEESAKTAPESEGVTEEPGPSSETDNEPGTDEPEMQENPSTDAEPSAPDKSGSEGG